MEIRYDRVSKQFGDSCALDELDIFVPDGTFLVLLGPSGCGKTTAMRIAAGLDEPSTGRIFIGDRDVTGIPPRSRDIAMVFQSYALYPHLTVSENIGYPLRIRRMAKPQIHEQVDRVAASLGLGPYLDRKPRHLSGGQRQRVALARAIIRQPAAFLMDEPLSNLDAQLRSQMRTEIKRLQRDLSTTTLYVTHDQVEAMTMADQVAILRAGALQQLAPPQEIYSKPANTFVARFVGSPPMNILQGHVSGGVFRCPAGNLLIPAHNVRGDAQLGFRPEAADITAPSTGDNCLAAQVYAVETLGNEVIVTCTLGDESVQVRLPADSSARVGQNCALRVDGKQTHIFDAASGVRVETIELTSKIQVPTS